MPDFFSSKNKDVVLGLGQTGMPLYQLLSSKFPVEGIDVDTSKNTEKLNPSTYEHTNLVHICVPSDKVKDAVLDADRYDPLGTVIHSTIRPQLIDILREKSSYPIIYSPIRGVHAKMKLDLLTYTKFYAIDSDRPKDIRAVSYFKTQMSELGIQTEQMPNTKTLALAKILTDTSYLGWLVSYAQITKMICDKHNVDYDTMWTFAEEIQQRLNNRPKMYPGKIGGHCVLPNLDLIRDPHLNLIKLIDGLYRSHIDD